MPTSRKIVSRKRRNELYKDFRDKIIKSGNQFVKSDGAYTFDEYYGLRYANERVWFTPSPEPDSLWPVTIDEALIIIEFWILLTNPTK